MTSVPINRFSLHGCGMRYTIIALGLLCATPAASHAEIRFSEASSSAGISLAGPTAASSWGDFNNDGWPDLWVSNHHGHRPNLYLNRQDGTFTDVSPQILVDNTSTDADFLGPTGKTLAPATAPDYHGAAWADFDNDGDQDLMVLTGGGAGRGASAKRLFVNERGKLVNKAKELGVDYHLGRGRTPLWLDVNQDGKLDALLMNHPRTEAPSAVFLQTNAGFAPANTGVGFPQSEPSLTEQVLARITDFIASLRSRKPGAIKVIDEFAQLADLSGDGRVDLIAYMQPTRIYSMTPTGLGEFTHEMPLPQAGSVQDAAIEDLNGDGRVDWYLVRSKPWVLDLVQVDATHLRGNLASKAGKSLAVSFVTAGAVTFDIHRPWMDPSDPARAKKPQLLLGTRRLELPESSLTLSPGDEAITQSPPTATDAGEIISIQLDPDTNTWTLRSSVPSIGFTIGSTEPIASIDTDGFEPSKGELKNILLINEGKRFKARQDADARQDPTACSSVAAGDFDNDMDIDLYLVCTAPTQNQPNLLYENDGQGNFTRVAQAGGAEGSMKGRGNQVAMADYDRDGFLDLFITNGAGPPPFADGPQQLFRNLGNGNRWLEIDLRGTVSNRDGIGATITLETGNKVQVRQQGGGMHSFSQNHARIHFGLGDNIAADRLTVLWPSGARQELRNVSANQILLIEEPRPGQ